MADEAFSRPELSPEERLFRAVVNQAFADATRITLSPHAKRRMGRAINLDTERARDWLTEDSKDFRTVCELANMDPCAVIAKARQSAAMGWSRAGRYFSLGLYVRHSEDPQ